MQEVECVVDHPVMAPTLEVVLQPREVRPPIRVSRNHLAVDDEFARRQTPYVHGYRRKPICPVEAGTRVERRAAVEQVSLDAVAVELEFMNETSRSGNLGP